MPAASPVTVEQFAGGSHEDRRAELVRGVIVPIEVSCFQHGFVCANIARLLKVHVHRHQVGRVVGHAGVITHRKPDSVRAPDVAFFSYKRLPKPIKPHPYPQVAPELVFEVRSPDDTWPNLLAKAAEYLRAGVLIAVIVDPARETAHVFRDDEPVQVLKASNYLTLPKWLANWRVQVKRFFE